MAIGCMVTRGGEKTPHTAYPTSIEAPANEKAPIPGESERCGAREKSLGVRAEIPTCRLTHATRTAAATSVVRGHSGNVSERGWPRARGLGLGLGVGAGMWGPGLGPGLGPG